MKDIMKYYLQLITLVFCLFVSACSDDDETTTPVFPDLQKIECEIGDTKTLTFEAADNWIIYPILFYLKRGFQRNMMKI